MKDVQPFDRNLAIKVCFANYFNASPADEIIENLKVTEMNDQLALTENSRVLIDFTIDHEDAIDATIQNHLKKNSLHRISILDRIILRIGIAELMLKSDRNSIDIIEEILEVSHEFCSESSIELINGILDALIQDDEFKEKINTY